jgi:hypothetical protein
MMIQHVPLNLFYNALPDNSNPTVQPTQLVTPEIMFQAKEHWAAHPLPETAPAV